MKIKMKDGQNMTVEEMQVEIEKMIPTPEQVLDAIDTKMFKLKNITDESIYRDITPEYSAGYNDAIDDICIWLEDNVWDYLETGYISDFEILKKFEVSKMIEDIEKLKKE